MVFNGGAEKVLAAVPDSHLELLAGGVPCPQVEDAERFTELLLDFVSKRAPAA